MLIRSTNSLNEVLSSLKHELHRGVLDKRHPFRYCILSTFGSEFPESRYVVLRKVDEALNCFIHTDERSQKTDEIINNNNTSILLYHPSKKVQIRMKGEAYFEKDKEGLWNSMSANARKAYSSEKAPGNEISSPEKAWDWSENSESHHFSIIKFVPTHIEILQLSGEKHLRAAFVKNPREWKGNWLVP